MAPTVTIQAYSDHVMRFSDDRNDHNNDAEVDGEGFLLKTFNVPAPMNHLREHTHLFENHILQALLVRDAGKDVLNGYSLGPKKKGVQVFYGPVEGSNWYTIKSVTEASTAAYSAFELLASGERVPDFDEMTAKVDILEKLSHRSEIRLISAKGVMFTSPRDFCVSTTCHTLADGRHVVASRSVDLHEPRKGFVRAMSLISGYIIEPLPEDPNRCRITVIAHFDLGGSIPSSVVNFLGTSAPIKLLTRIRELLENN